MVQITIFWSQKGLEQVFDGFSCISMVCIIQNPKILDAYPILGKIKQNEANFHKKMGPKA